MSRLKLSKKLKPAKKAWKSLSNNFQSKLHKLNIQKAFKTTLQHLLSLFHSITHLITSKTTHHRSLTSSKSLYSPSTSYYHFQHKNFAPIPIYNKPSSSSSSIRHAQGNTSREIEKVHGDDNNNSKNNEMNTIEDAWKAVVAKSPMMQVDQKAEEFIYKFREDIRLQKEKSLLEFHERLARST
ncbi:uncharacterized protein LOC127097350 [Lathyrus oleraceus]|uniref:DUF761 domain-containing protein n=1 Tax=Pisum sativum TaxID=3888 RepID=A0A9D4WBC5_PEA|nr:uncharacterized protein LOC127097350 [Pisum sativum]KAI5397501.1 hypothetical protein KIW84_063354 [Pisum sativum]